MEGFDVFRDITERTGGSVYLGVVGPVRTGKSTFIKRFMDLLVMPNITDANDRQRAQDELPQSGSGKTVMTTQPHFVPDEPITLHVQEHASFRVRLVDCVGYAVQGARGFADEEGPRMVRTPWFDHDIPFEEAAEIGTRKVIAEHSTIGLVVVTDGTITDIPREGYIDAERRVIKELAELGKPFVVLVNSTAPQSAQAQGLADELGEAYGVRAVPVDCQNMSRDDILAILREVLYEFPVREIGVKLPSWVEELDEAHWLKQSYLETMRAAIAPVQKLRDVEGAAAAIAAGENVDKATLADMQLGSGKVRIEVQSPDGLFYTILQELTGFEISGNHDLVRLMKELAIAKTEYDKMAEGLEQVRENGYGIVAPRLEDITFDEPQIIRKGGQFGVKLQASAPSIHMVRADIVTEVTPFVGTEKQGEELARFLSDEFENDPSKVWNSDFLGKSLQDLVREGIQTKLQRMPDNARRKLQDTLTKIINEGSGGLICIIL
ncbi:MAG TPA: stage IV sporulation protein A [Limnochordia bacterium]|nr:stage IV sporulation protein A [Limnochordia bacterium]